MPALQPTGWREGFRRTGRLIRRNDPAVEYGATGRSGYSPTISTPAGGVNLKVAAGNAGLRSKLLPQIGNRPGNRILCLLNKRQQGGIMPSNELLFQQHLLG